MKFDIKIENDIPLLGSIIYKNQSISHSSCELYHIDNGIDILDRILNALFSELSHKIWYWDAYHEVLHISFLKERGVIDYLLDKFNKNDIKLIFIDNNLGKKNHPFLKKINYESNPYFLGLTHLSKFEISPRIFGKHFSCLNLHPKEHRTKIFHFLYENNLIIKSYFSYVPYDNTHPYHHKLNTELEINHEIPEDKPATYKIEYKPLVEHRNSFCSIVTETYFFNYQMDELVNDAIFITEKVEKCISAGQPFILLGRPYFLQKMKELGFQTFSNFWDESYDREEDDYKRFKMVANLILEISKLSLKQLEDLYKKIIPILKHNQMINENFYNLNKKICSTQFLNHECIVENKQFEI